MNLPVRRSACAAIRLRLKVRHRTAAIPPRASTPRRIREAAAAAQHYQVYYTTREAQRQHAKLPAGRPRLQCALTIFIRGADWKQNKPFQTRIG